MHALQKLIFSAGFEPQSYNGRGMYGKTCLGFVTRGDNYMSQLIITAREWDNADEAWDALEEAFQAGPRTDNMGYDTIVYFPGIPFEDEDTEDDEVCDSLDEGREDFHSDG